MSQAAAYTPVYREPGIPCLVCGTLLVVRSARGRKSNKLFLMLVCPADARHFRAFINDQAYVQDVLAQLAQRGEDSP